MFDLLDYSLLDRVLVRATDRFSNERLKADS
jgi:hypothetical protein